MAVVENDGPADLSLSEGIIDPRKCKAPEAWRLIGAEISEQLDYEPMLLAPKLHALQIPAAWGPGRIADRLPCRRICRSAASQRPEFWPRSSLANIAITFRSAGRKRFLIITIEFTCDVKTCLAG